MRRKAPIGNFGFGTGITGGRRRRATRADLHGQHRQSQPRAYQAATWLRPAASTSERHAEFLGRMLESTLSPIGSAKDADGPHHYRYQQNFRGIPVWGEHVVVSETRTAACASSVAPSADWPDRRQHPRPRHRCLGTRHRQTASIGSSDATLITREEPFDDLCG